MIYKNVDIIPAKEKYEDVVVEVENLNRQSKKIENYVQILSALTVLPLCYGLYCSIKAENDVMSFIIFMLLLLGIGIALPLFNEEEKYAVPLNIVYSHFFSNNTLISASVMPPLLSSAVIKIVTENHLHEVKEQKIYFCKIIERTDLKTAILDLERSIFYVPFCD